MLVTLPADGVVPVGMLLFGMVAVSLFPSDFIPPPGSHTTPLGEAAELWPETAEADEESPHIASGELTTRDGSFAAGVEPHEAGAAAAEDASGVLGQTLEVAGLGLVTTVFGL